MSDKKSKLTKQDASVKDTESANRTQQSPLKPQRLQTCHIDMEDKRFQVRQGLDADVVSRYQDMITPEHGLSSFKERPVLWQCPKSKAYVVCDGWHRIQAAINAGENECEANILIGTEKEALLQAALANLKHGLPLKLEDRIEACRRIIEALSDDQGVPPANTRLAELLEVSEGTIRNYRHTLEQTGKLTPASVVKGKDGVSQKVRKSRKAKDKQCPTPPVSSSSAVPSEPSETGVMKVKTTIRGPSQEKAPSAVKSDVQVSPDRRDDSDRNPGRGHDIPDENAWQMHRQALQIAWTVLDENASASFTGIAGELMNALKSLHSAGTQLQEAYEKGENLAAA